MKKYFHRTMLCIIPLATVGLFVYGLRGQMPNAILMVVIGGCALAIEWINVGKEQGEQDE